MGFIALTIRSPYLGVSSIVSLVSLQPVLLRGLFEEKVTTLGGMECG